MYPTEEFEDEGDEYDRESNIPSSSGSKTQASAITKTPREIILEENEESNAQSGVDLRLNDALDEKHQNPHALVQDPPPQKQTSACCVLF
jgi:hypothetical protein